MVGAPSSLGDNRGMSNWYRPEDPTSPAAGGAQGPSHDTMVIQRPSAGGPQWQPGPAAPYPGQPGLPYDPAGSAAHWEARYRRQRMFLGVLAAFVLLGTLAVVGVGFAAWQAIRSNPLVDAAQGLSDTLGGSSGDRNPLDGLLPQVPSPEGATPEEGTPTDPGAPGEGQGELALPEELRDLGSALGITDVRQLLDLAVANGLMTQEQADALAAAIGIGSALGSLGG